MQLAPIILFVYSRLEHTQRTIEALRLSNLAKDSDIFIYSDAAKNEAVTDAVSIVRSYLKKITGFRTITIRERDVNFGLARSIIDGVTEMLKTYEQTIILEDDLVVSPHFLSYMNTALNMYANDARVASIHGYQYPIKKALPETFFLRGSDCWGWATWRRAWQCFNPDGRALLDNLEAQHLTHAFDLDGAYGFTQMLQDQIDHKNDSWAIRWHASCYLNNMLTLFPHKSLVTNIGNDGSGTHSQADDSHHTDHNLHPIHVTRIPIEESAQARLALIKFYKKQRLAILLSRISKKILFLKLVIKAYSIFLIKQLLPPFLSLIIRKIKIAISPQFSGNYQSWELANNASIGYASQPIFENVLKANFLIRQGVGVFERDSVLFYKEDYSWPLLAVLFWAAAIQKGRIRILDFGGSLGSVYIQNKKFLNYIDDKLWCVVEQMHFDLAGKEYFQDETLKFCGSINECLINYKPNIALFAAVIEYLPNLYDVLDAVLLSQIDIIIIDRSPLYYNSDEKIVIQHVSSAIYNASIPLKINSIIKIENYFKAKGWRKLVNYPSIGGAGVDWAYQGVIFKK